MTDNRATPATRGATLEKVRARVERAERDLEILYDFDVADIRELVDACATPTLRAPEVEDGWLIDAAEMLEGAAEYSDDEDWELRAKRFAARLRTLAAKGSTQSQIASENADLCVCVPSHSPYPAPRADGTCPSCGRRSRAASTGREVKE